MINIKIRKAVIPAAGLGTRFLPASKALPKEMLPILNKPTLQYIVEEAVNSGIEDILIIVGRNKEVISNHFSRSLEIDSELEDPGNIKELEKIRKISNMVNIHYISQREPLGLGHAIFCARSFVGNEVFAVLLGDDVIYSEIPGLGQMIQIYEEYKASVLAVKKVDKEDMHKYGNLKGDLLKERIYKVETLIEKPNPNETYSKMGIVGRYILTPRIFKILEGLNPGKNNEIQLTDALNILVEREDMYAYEFHGKRYDLGNKKGFLEANIEYALRDEELKKGLLKFLNEII